MKKIVAILIIFSILLLTKNQGLLFFIFGKYYFYTKPNSNGEVIEADCSVAQNIKNNLSSYF